MFSDYKGGGIRPVTGVIEAGANIGKMYMQGIGQMGESLAKGIQAYNENSAKSEMANVKIAGLSQDIANKIAMYSQDPEIAQSGVLQGLIQTGQTLSEAPTKGLTQRIGLVHEAETKLAGFGQQLQESMFLRGRAIERGIQEGLKKFENATTTTDPIFYEDPNFAVDPNQTIQQQKDRVMAFFKKVRASNPRIQGSDEDFWAGWVNTAQQKFAKGIEGLNPSVTSAQLEALQAEQNIAKNQKSVNALSEEAIGGMIMNKDGIYEESAPLSSSVKDYAAMTATPADRPYNDVADAMKFLGYEDKKSNVPELTKRLAQEKENITKLEDKQAKFTGQQREDESNKKTLETITDGLGKLLPTETTLNVSVKTMLSRYRQQNPNKPITPELVQKYIDASRSTPIQSVLGAVGEVFNEGILQASKNPLGIGTILKASVEHNRYFTKAEAAIIDKAVREEAKQMDNPKGGFMISDSYQRQIDNSKEEINKLQSQIKTETPVRQASPKVGLGELVVGQMETTRPLTVSERKSQVQDFLTQRFGAIDPTDPTGKKRVPVQGFDSFFQKAVPESEIKEFTTEGGTRLIRINDKWEMVKGVEPKSMAEIRKDNIGVFGQQTRDGRLVPTEFIPDSGVFVGGLFKGSDGAVDKFQEELPKLIDARRGVKVLMEINDQMGESLSPTAQGRALVEEMNLSAMLRTDIVGVGTVSNYEQGLIKRVTENSTNFFSLESKDRAILIALASRVDRRIKNLSAAHGLTVQIRDVNSADKYEALRQQYLKAKGIL